MARDSQTAARLSAVLWSALSYLGKKREARDLLPVGEDQKVDVTIEGKIGRSKICERVVGHLNRSPDQEAASNKAAPSAEVVAALLDKFDDSDRHAVVQEIETHWAETKELPRVEADRLAEAKRLLANLRSQVIKPKAGAVVFRPTS